MKGVVDGDCIVRGLATAEREPAGRRQSCPAQLGVWRPANIYPRVRSRLDAGGYSGGNRAARMSNINWDATWAVICEES